MTYKNNGEAGQMKVFHTVDELHAGRSTHSLPQISKATDRADATPHSQPHPADATKCNGPFHEYLMPIVKRMGGKYKRGPLKLKKRIQEKLEDK